MICIADCVKAKCLACPVPCSADDDYSPDPQLLRIGTLEIDTDYTIYFQDQGSGVTKKINITSNGTGFLEIDMNDYPGFFHENTSFITWVTLRDASIVTTEAVTFDSYNIWNCFILEFQKISQDSETLAGLSIQIVEI